MLIVFKTVSFFFLDTLYLNSLIFRSIKNFCLLCVDNQNCSRVTNRCQRQTYSMIAENMDRNITLCQENTYCPSLQHENGNLLLIFFINLSFLSLNWDWNWQVFPIKSRIFFIGFLKVLAHLEHIWKNFWN